MWCSRGCRSWEISGGGGSPILSIASRMIDVMELLTADAQRSVSLKRRAQAVVGLPYVGSADRRQALAHQLLRKPGIRLDARTAIELIEQLRLHRAAAQRLGVRNLRVEHHHRVARDEAIGEAPLESQGDLPAAPEAGIQHRIAHLAVVLERHLRDGLGVGTAQPLELPEHRLPFPAAPDDLIEHGAVLEPVT